MEPYGNLNQQRYSNFLRSHALADFLPVMYGNEPRRWDPALEGPDRWRFIVNTLTRMRL